MNTALARLQSSLQRHVIDGDTDIAASIASGRGIAVERRLAIYHHAYRARLVAALRDTFGHTATYLGDEWFDADALAFVETHPSTQPDLNGYGGGFAAWLAERHPRDGDIAELAALDWALRRAFDGEDSPVLALADLAAVAPEAWERIGLSLVPTCARLVLEHNTLALWHALDQDLAPPRAEVLAEPCELLIWRRGHQPHFRSLGQTEAAALTALHDGASFAKVCALLAQRRPEHDAAAEAGTLLRRWIDDELIAAVVDRAADPR